MITWLAFGPRLTATTSLACLRSFSRTASSTAICTGTDSTAHGLLQVGRVLLRFCAVCVRAAMPATAMARTSSKGFIDILTAARSTPVLSGLTRILQTASQCRKKLVGAKSRGGYRCISSIAPRVVVHHSLDCDKHLHR